MITSTDTKFFTNEDTNTLFERFKDTLKEAQFFDMLVGYFRISGFNRLYDVFEDIDKIRILIGLNIDKKTYDLIETSNNDAIVSHKKTKDQFEKELIENIQTENTDEENIEKSLIKFIELLQTDSFDSENDKHSGGNGKKLEFRAYPGKNIHAKVYISRFRSKLLYGSVITGSSNFTEYGLSAQKEFNVELKDKPDVDYAIEKFNKLWEESVPISDEFVNEAKDKTWLNDKITPYLLYLKFLYEYFEEDINTDKQIEIHLPKNFIELEYQKQAVNQANRILHTYNGIILADVVGLGKTFITSMLLQQIEGKKLVICPPRLKEYWETALRDFGVRGAKVESLGKIEKIHRKEQFREYEYIIIDEAHRFRNDNTQSYSMIKEICLGKKVVLVSATPFNNTIDDLFSLIKLFQTPKKSTIPGVRNLEKLFNALKNMLRASKHDESEKISLIPEVAAIVRDKLLRHIMIRRTRTDIKKYFSNDINKQGLAFPEIAEPEKFVYFYEGKIEKVFNDTISLLKKFTYSRYVPILYLKNANNLTEFEKQQQKNVGGFMKAILVKRLESSFYAFKKSVGRFIISYEKFIDMFDCGTVYISKKIDVYDMLEKDNIDELENFVAEDKVSKRKSSEFRQDNETNFRADLEKDLDILKAIDNIWANVDDDPKLNEFKNQINNNDNLKDKKIIIFTESKETADYLFAEFLDNFGSEVFSYSGEGGKRNKPENKVSHNISMDLIENNFDPNTNNHTDDIKLLITTDILSEGINLHKTNILINYDLPWNPTRVLQRAGRINRVGTQHNFIYFYNFFPASHSDKELHLEDNVKTKIQLFHDILGEDAKYLSDGEEFGSREIFEKLTSKKFYTGEDEKEDSELKYLNVIRDIRDNDEELFNKIKKLPLKAYSVIKKNEKERPEASSLLTFFRSGKLKKFYLSSFDSIDDLTFFDAASLLECKKDAKKELRPEDYFKLLRKNKNQFKLDMESEPEKNTKTKGRSNVSYIQKRMRTKEFSNYKGFTVPDEEFINSVKQMLNDGNVSKKPAQNIKKELERTIDPLQMLHILKKHIKVVHTDSDDSDKTGYIKKEVILSEYFLK